MIVSAWVALVRVAWASGCPPYSLDIDGDGYCLDGDPSDCDPIDPYVNPAEPEDGVDRVDQDCDGSLSIRREFVEQLTSLANFTATRATANPLAGEAVLTPTLGLPASIYLAYPFEFPSGQLEVTVAVSALSSATCNVLLSSSTGGGISSALVVGDNSFSF
jgi:hypothetical protein